MRSLNSDLDLLEGVSSSADNLSNKIPVLTKVVLWVSGMFLGIMIRCLLVIKAFAHKSEPRKRTGGHNWVWGALERSTESRG